MITDIWTLEPQGSPGSAIPLAGRGIKRASLSRPNQDAGVLSLQVAARDIASADLSAYAYKSTWVLRRDGVVFFRGRVRNVPRSSSTGTATIEIADAWRDLDNIPYLQTWDVVGDDGAIVEASIPRAMLSAADARKNTAQCLQAALASAAGMGISLGLASAIKLKILPTIEASNLSVGALIRQILSYHPGATASILYGESADSLQVIDPALAAPIDLTVGDRPVQDFDLARRDDLVVSSVHVIYEAAVTRFNEVAGTDGDAATIRANRRLAVFEDVYPAGAPRRDDSLVVGLPTQPINANTPAPPVPQMVSIKTVPIPADGAIDPAAENFWLDLLGLSALGIESGDVKLASTAAEGQMHRTRFAWQAEENGDPHYEVPSAINPAAAPVWRPPSVTDLPNMLVAGTLAEWMKVSAAELIVEATVAIRKSTVDADPERLKAVLKMSARVGTIQGIPAYIIDRPMRIVGTDARTKVYRNWTATAVASPVLSNQAVLQLAREESVVPGLARALYEDRATAPWEGTIPLAARETGSHAYLGRVINLIHPDRPEWASMRAIVQSESIDITGGRTEVRVGPPKHLSVQDRAALWSVGRTSRSERAEASISPPAPSTNDDSDDALSRSGSGGVFPGTIPPKKEPDQLAQPVPRLWDIMVVSTDPLEVKLLCPGVVRKTDDADSTSLVTIVDQDEKFTLSAGEYLALEWTKDGVCTLKKQPEWEGFPFPYLTTTDAEDFLVFDKTIVPLWKALDASTVGLIYLGRHIPVSAAIVLERLAPDAHFEISNYLAEHPDGKMIDVDRFWPGFGAA